MRDDADVGAEFFDDFQNMRGEENGGAAADALRALSHSGQTQLTIYAEPAPYCLPPVNLFDWTIVLAPRDAGPKDLTNGVAAYPADHSRRCRRR